MSGKPLLTYFDARGRMEQIRFLYVAAGVDFDQAYLTKKDQVEKLRGTGKLLFNQVPLLEDGGKCYIQTGAIVRHIARKYDLDGGPDEYNKYRADMLTEGTRDFGQTAMAWKWKSDAQYFKDVKETAGPRYLPIFEKELAASKSGFLVGDKLSMADTGLLEIILYLEELVPEILDSYPHIKKFIAKMKALPQFAAFLPKRHPLNTEEKLVEIKTALGYL